MPSDLASDIHLLRTRVRLGAASTAAVVVGVLANLVFIAHPFNAFAAGLG